MLGDDFDDGRRLCPLAIPGSFYEACLVSTGTKIAGHSILAQFFRSAMDESHGTGYRLMSNVTDEGRSSALVMTLFCNAVLQSGPTAIAGIRFVQFRYTRVLVRIASPALAATFLFGLLVAPADCRVGHCQRIVTSLSFSMVCCFSKLAIG